MERTTIKDSCEVCGALVEMEIYAAMKLTGYLISHEGEGEHIVSVEYVPGLMCKSVGLCE